MSDSVYQMGKILISGSEELISPCLQVNVYNERKYLAHSLNDTKTAIEELNKIVSGIVLVVLVVVWLLLMGIATTKVLVFFSSQLLLVAFVFSSTCRAVFEGLVFVFIMHPFDVGDRCVIDGIQVTHWPRLHLVF